VVHLGVASELCLAGIAEGLLRLRLRTLVPGPAVPAENQPTHHHRAPMGLAPS
jgi:hypothetical protein